MNAIGLFLANGEAVSPHLCGTCKRVWESLDAAETCCKCSVCGGASEGTVGHDECFARFNREADAERLLKATLDPDYSGPFIVQDKFYSDIERLFGAVDEDEIPEFGFCCYEQSPVLDIGDIIENVASGMHDWWEPYPCEELERGIAAWNKANKGNGSWVECGGRKWSRAELIRMRSAAGREAR